MAARALYQIKNLLAFGVTKEEIILWPLLPKSAVFAVCKQIVSGRTEIEPSVGHPWLALPPCSPANGQSKKSES